METSCPVVLGVDSAINYGSIDTENIPSISNYSRKDDSEKIPLVVHDKAYEHAVSVKALHEITVIHVPDEHGHIAHYPREQEDLRHRDEVLHKDENKNAALSILEYCLDTFKCCFSMAFLLISMYSCTAAILTQQSVGTVAMSLTGRILFVTLYWILILWLEEMEGSQSCLVGLQPIPKSLYRHSHPHAYRSTCLAQQGDNMERFIVGRQFLIVVVVFVSNIMSFPVPGVSLFGLPDQVTNILLGAGIAVTANAVMLGQVAQINAANCMLDFINTFFGLFTTYVSLFFDATGLLHSVYLVQILFAQISNTPIVSSEPPRNIIWQKIFFWMRVLFSCVTLGYFCALTLSALYHDETTMWEGVPDSASVVALVVLLIFVGLLEGMQIALFCVVNLPQDEIQKQHPLAFKSCELTFRGANLQAFLIGRQMCVTLGMFVVARITNCSVAKGDPTIFGVSDGLQYFFNTGLPGAVITTVAGSLAWRIIASSFAVAFLEIPLVYAIIRLCLLVEASGVCSATWWLALVQKKLMGYQLDEVYIGKTPLEGDDTAKHGHSMQV